MKRVVKFSDVYHSAQDKIIPFEDIERIYNESPELFQTQYNGYLHCPKCRVPQMVYCNADPSYIRVYPNQMHGNNCDHFHPPLLKKELEKACEDEKNLKSLNKSLNYLLRTLMNEDTSLDKVSEVSPIIKKSKKASSATSERTIQHHIPSRKLTKAPRDYDLGIAKNYYGDVSLKVAKTWGRGCFVDVCAVDGSELFCSLKLSDEAYKKFLCIQQKTNCKIAFTTVLDYSEEAYGRNKKRYIRGAITEPELFCFFDQNNDKYPETL